jgi:hypothetical protein
MGVFHSCGFRRLFGKAPTKSTNTRVSTDVNATALGFQPPKPVRMYFPKGRGSRP